MMTSPFFCRRTLATVVSVSAALALGAGCTDSTALDLSPLPLAAADVDAERTAVVAFAADPAVRAVIGGGSSANAHRAAPADPSVKDLVVSVPRLRYPGTSIVLPPSVRGRHFTFDAGTWTGAPSPDAPPNGISIALYADAFAPGGAAVGSLVLFDSSTATHAAAFLQVRNASRQPVLDGWLMESLTDGSISTQAALTGTTGTLQLFGTTFTDGRFSSHATLRTRPTSWSSASDVVRGGGEVTLRVGQHTLRRTAFSRLGDWNSDSLVYRVNARRIATAIPADTTLRRAHPEARALVAAMSRFLQESPSPEGFTSRMSVLLMRVLPRPAP